MSNGDTCTACTHPVRPAITVGGKLIYLDPDPVENGVVEFVTYRGAVRARVAAGHEPPVLGTAYRFHHCPPGSPAPPGPACAVCLQPMPRGIALEQKWTTHPGCDLPEARAAAARRRPVRRR